MTGHLRPVIGVCDGKTAPSGAGAMRLVPCGLSGCVGVEPLLEALLADRWPRARPASL